MGHSPDKEPTKSLRGALALVSRRKLLHQIPRSGRNATEQTHFATSKHGRQCSEENKTTIAEKGERRKNLFIQTAALLKQFSPRTLGVPTAGDGVAICMARQRDPTSPPR
jgi:hypothetical protein